MNPLPLPRYVLSGPHLSGYRVVLGYETLADAQDAQAALALPMDGVGLDREGQVSDEIGQLTDVFERPFDGEDDPRLRVARVLTRAEAEAVLEHSGDLIAILSALPEAGPAEVGWRPEVRAFADLMEKTLQANDHKGGWKDELPSLDLLPRLREETVELEEAIAFWITQTNWGEAALYMPRAVERVAREAADVANFAMMIADVCGALPPPPLDRAGGGAVEGEG